MAGPATGCKTRGRRLDKVGTSAGNIHRKCRKISDKHRTDPLWYRSPETARRKKYPYYKYADSDMAGPATGGETQGRRLDKVGTSAGNIHHKCRKLSDKHRLTPLGTDRLKQPGERGAPITNTQIRTWRDLPQEAKRKAGGWIKWVQAQGISIASAGHFLTNAGLTSFGTDRLKQPGERGTPITNTQIRTWRDLPQEAKREAGGWIKWAQALGINIGSACICLSNTGLTPKGVVRLQAPAERGIPHHTGSTSDMA
ncbi:phage-like protein [Salmonella enterica subsp. enterica serovar Sanjuan]|uniref:Phage-like protein n=1 Tax=Salmonella enterica subsp. enterica serovar Sanjuan TaxID=1160765 RepID=A0A3S4FHJ3_SALET|nr:phage-like protein [Salmonella enterica subsp. enterica serovar Sanjuan]